jgi:malate dehydrogenase
MATTAPSASGDRGADHTDGAIALSLSPEPPLVVLITGAAGAICYSLIFMAASGALFGARRRLVLHLLDLPACADKLEALAMELQDCAYPLLAGLVATSDYAVAFAGVDYALLVGSRPRAPGMERKDLLAANAAIFRGQGEALDRHAKRTVRVLCVGNPANTNALIAARAAPGLPRTAFTALTRLDHNRATAMLAQRLGANPRDIQGVVVWGNHSTSQYADARFALREGHPRPQDSSSVAAALGDAAWLQGDFVRAVQQRGAEVMGKRQGSSAASAAQAICDHVRDWACGTRGHWVSMAVHMDGSAYGIAEDIYFSVPCIMCVGGGGGGGYCVLEWGWEGCSGALRRPSRATLTHRLTHRHPPHPHPHKHTPPPAWQAAMPQASTAS